MPLKDIGEVLELERLRASGRRNDLVEMGGIFLSIFWTVPITNSRGRSQSSCTAYMTLLEKVTLLWAGLGYLGLTSGLDLVLTNGVVGQGDRLLGLVSSSSYKEACIN